MVVKIRLARFGRRHAPIYNIVIAQARSAQTNRPIEVIGTYDPIPVPPVDGKGKGTKNIELDTARAKYWLGVGAQPSDPVWRLLSMFGLLEPKWSVTRLQSKAEASTAKPKELKNPENVAEAPQGTTIGNGKSEETAKEAQER